MLITNHVVAGALVGAVAPGPVSAAVLGAASHYALDAVPHWGNENYGEFLKVARVDGIVGLVAMGAIARLTPRRRRSAVIAGMLGSCFPDADKPGREFFGRSPFPRSLDRWHAAIQRESPTRMPQEVVVAAAGLVLLRGLLGRRD